MAATYPAKQEGSMLKLFKLLKITESIVISCKSISKFKILEGPGGEMKTSSEAGKIILTYYLFYYCCIKFQMW